MEEEVSRCTDDILDATKKVAAAEKARAEAARELSTLSSQVMDAQKVCACVCVLCASTAITTRQLRPE
jgi:hypothetical protein